MPSPPTMHGGVPCLLLQGVPCLPTTHHPHPLACPERARVARAWLTLMMLLRRGVARAASKSAASPSAGEPPALSSATPLRRSRNRPPGATAAQSPEAGSGPTRESSSASPVASGGVGRPSAMLGRVWAPRARQRSRGVGLDQARSGTAERPRHTLFYCRAAATFSRSGIARVETVETVPRGTLSGVRVRGAREAPERGCKRRPLGSRQKAPGAGWAGGPEGRTRAARTAARAGRPRPRAPATCPASERANERGAAAPGRAVAAAASAPLCCDREGKTCFDSPRGLAVVGAS